MPSPLCRRIPAGHRVQPGAIALRPSSGPPAAARPRSSRSSPVSFVPRAGESGWPTGPCWIPPAIAPAAGAAPGRDRVPGFPALSPPFRGAEPALRPAPRRGSRGAVEFSRGWSKCWRSVISSAVGPAVSPAANRSGWPWAGPVEQPRLAADGRTAGFAGNAAKGPHPRLSATHGRSVEHSRCCSSPTSRPRCAGPPIG